jgi:hypothetical protein
VRRQSDHDDDAMWAAYNRFHMLCDTRRFQKIVARFELVRGIADVPGDIVDAGAYKGVSTMQFAHALETFQPHGRSKVLSCDTFEATFPLVREDERQSAEDHMLTYEANAYDELVAALDRLELTERVSILRGDITETLPAYVEKNPGFRISLLHCDLDVYKPTLAVLRAAWARLVPGGMAVFDEYAVENWGESDAVDEFLSSLDNPPRLRVLEGTYTPTAYCVKERY